MKDSQEIVDIIALKKIWPVIMHNGSIHIQRVIDPHRRFLERMFDGCWLETKFLPNSPDACPVTARYSLENGKTMKVLSSQPGRKLEADFNCYVFFAELVLQERYRKYEFSKYSEPDEYVRGPELDKIMNRLN